jgi:hypothetical protein
LIIHILSRRRKQIVEFSSVRLLLQARHKNIERLNLREIVLLILRTLVVLLLVLAAARPLVRGFWGTAVGDHEPTGVVLVLDGTLSMQYTSEGESLFERSLERARSILEFLREDDRVRIFYSDSEVHPIGGEDEFFPFEAQALLEGIEAGNYGGRLDDCLRRAVEAAGEITLPWKEVYVFTDLQKGSVGEDLFEGVEDGLPVLFFTERDSGSVNRFLGAVDLIGGGELGENRWALKVQVGSSGGAGKPGIFPRLYLDGEMAGIVEVQLAGEGDRTASFPLKVYPGAGRRVRVEVEKDGLELDDVRFFITGDERPLNLIRGKGIDSAKPIRVALDLLEGKGVGRAWERTDPVSVDDGSDPNVDPTVSNLPEGAIAGSVLITYWSDREGIREAVDNGYGLVLFPDPGAEVTLGAPGLPVASSGEVKLGGDSFLGIAAMTGENPPGFAGALEEGLRRIRVTRYYSLSPGRKWEEGGGNMWTIDLEGGDPFIIGGEMGAGGRLVLLSVSPGEESSDLFRSPLFLPLLDGILRYATGAEVERGYLCGEPVNLRIPNTAQGEALSVHLPGGSEFMARPGSDGEVRFDETGEPGFYSVTSGLRVLDEFTVNVDTGESNISEMDTMTLKENLSPMSIGVVRKGVGVEDMILTRRGGREITTWLLLAVFIVLMVESHISGRIQRE